MNILVILSNPFTNDPRVSNETKSLVDKGHKVTILCWDKSGENPSFEKKDGVKIFRSYNTWLMKRLPFDIFRLHFWWRKGFKDVLEIHEKSPFDVIHCHDLDTLPIGVKLKKKFGLPLIYDAHEIWGYMVARDLPKPWANYYLKKEKRLIKHVDKVITVNEPLKDYFEKICNKDISIIMNCKPLQETEYNPPKNDKFTILYLGSLSRSRFLIELAETVEKLSDIHCIIGGKGKPDYEEALVQKCSVINNVDFIGLNPMENVIPLTKKADAVVCMTSPLDPNNSIATANKQFEAMVCGRPIICTEDTYPGFFTEKENCGLISAFTKNDLEKTILLLKNNPNLCKRLGKNALEAAKREYNWDKQEEKLIKIYDEIAK